MKYPVLRAHFHDIAETVRGCVGARFSRVDRKFVIISKGPKPTSAGFWPSACTSLAKSGPKSHWNDVGFKGGSEPGVLAETYLLQSKFGGWGRFSMAARSGQEISPWEFGDIVEKAIHLAENAF